MTSLSFLPGRALQHVRSFSCAGLICALAFAAGCETKGGTAKAGDGGAAGGSTGMPGTCKNDPCPKATACRKAHCLDEYKKCFGDNFFSADLSGGTCAEFGACQNKCPCGDSQSSCAVGCAMKLDKPCEACLTAAGSCQNTNCKAESDECAAKVAASAAGGVSGGAGTDGSPGSGGTGTGGSAGTDGAGTGGAAQCAAKASDSSCVTCIKQMCCPETAACGANSECNDLSICVGNCASGDDACETDCANTSPGGIDDYNALIDCANAGCVSSCQ